MSNRIAGDSLCTSYAQTSVSLLLQNPKLLPWFVNILRIPLGTGFQSRADDKNAQSNASDDRFPSFYFETQTILVVAEGLRSRVFGSIVLALCDKTRLRT